MELANAPLLRDPAGLLGRSPELAELARHAPSLRRAIERGRPFDAYRALFWASLLGKLKGELGVTAKTLLGHRRIFFKPLTGAPKMMTVNGVGTSLYGNADFDRNDGSYVATLFLVVVFVPVFPIASYLVRSATTNKGRQAWSFMAKVPMGVATYFWQRSIAIGILGLVLFGAGNAFEGYGHGTLHVVNGLDRDVTAELSGSSPVTVPAGGEVALRTKVGPHTIAVRDGARPLESQSIDVPRGRGAIVWNVLGAAPLFVSDIVYSKDGSDGPKGSLDVFCGDSLVVKNGIDYAFVDPPKELEMPEGSSSVTKTHMAVAPGGLSSCTGYLMAHGEAAKAAHIFLRAATVSKTPAAKLDTDVEALITVAPRDEAEAFTKDLLSRDDSVEAHRIYQDWLLATDQRARAVAEYDARASARPDDDGDAEYLALRVRDEPDERPMVDAAVARHPKHAFLRHMQVYAHMRQREFDVVAAAASVLRGLDAHLWTRDMDDHVAALVATGHGQDALSLVTGAAHDASIAHDDARHAEYLAFRVAHRLGTKEPALPHESTDSDALVLVQRVAAGIDVSATEVDEVKDPDLKAALHVAVAARKRPDMALTMVRDAPPRALAEVPTSIATLLLVEAVRRGDSRDLVDRLAAAAGGKRAADAMAAYVRDGTDSADLHDLPLEMQAAIDFGRSRATGVTPKEKSDRLARAKQADVLQGPVSVAIDGWPS